MAKRSKTAQAAFDLAEPVANQMGFVADKVFSYDTDVLGTGSAWMGAVCYSLQIFFDFNGYSLMAIGLGKMFGFEFNAPSGFSRSTVEEVEVLKGTRLKKFIEIYSLKKSI